MTVVLSDKEAEQVLKLYKNVVMTSGETTREQDNLVWKIREKTGKSYHLI
jgi:hypothetical protein